EISHLYNAALKNDRPGGGRDGWQLRFDWQAVLPKGVLAAQFNYTRMDDRSGYSALLANGAARQLDRAMGLIQYRQPLNPDLDLQVHLYHQRQNSNSDLFENTDTTFEIGISLRL